MIGADGVFEEIFLSFQSLPKWCGGGNLNAHEGLYDIVKNSINRLEDYSVQAKIAEYMSVYNASVSHVIKITRNAANPIMEVIAAWRKGQNTSAAGANWLKLPQSPIY